ncbi:globin CTT-X-like [Chironomus tepperi]|uniref:globin CTT-X-like n=1 Tax=Chironomus tepperi TaxID=113505 RepID=UPI00391F06F5
MKFLILALCIVAAMADPHWIMLDNDAVDHVKSSWKKVSHDEVDILAAVFKDHPDIQAKFPKFAGKDLESIKGTAAFATHAGRIVGFFGEYVALLGSEANQPAIKSLLHNLGTSHKGRGVVASQFSGFRDSMTNYLKAYSNWNADVSDSWDDAFDKAYAVIFETL